MSHPSDTSDANKIEKIEFWSLSIYSPSLALTLMQLVSDATQELDTDKRSTDGSSAVKRSARAIFDDLCKAMNDAREASLRGFRAVHAEVPNELFLEFQGFAKDKRWTDDWQAIEVGEGTKSEIEEDIGPVMKSEIDIRQRVAQAARRRAACEFDRSYTDEQIKYYNLIARGLDTMEDQDLKELAITHLEDEATANSRWFDESRSEQGGIIAPADLNRVSLRWHSEITSQFQRLKEAAQSEAAEV